MKCKEIQDLILSDYLDGEMGEKESAHIDEHIAGCQDCKKFCVDAKAVSAELFEAAGRVEPGEYIWQRIKEKIVAEKAKSPTFAETIFEKLRYVFYIPRPAFAIATIVTMLLIFGTVTRLIYSRGELPGTGMTGQIEYFDYIAQGAADSSANGNAGFGTAVERYFL